jgi:membrane protein
VRAEIGLREVKQLMACSARNWLAHDATTVGAALAFYCAFSLAPLLIILTVIIGKLIGEESAYDQVGVQLQAMFGPAMAKTLVGVIRASQHVRSPVAPVLSVAMLLFGATSVLAAIKNALEHIWGSETIRVKGVLDWIRTRLLSMGIMLALAFLLLVSLTLSTALTVARELITHRYAAIVQVLGLVATLVSLALVVGIFALIYRYMPTKRLSWGAAAVGSLLTTGLFYLGHWAVGLYLARSTETTAFGAAASFAALLLWLYYSAQILLFGAEFTACLGKLRDEGRRQSKTGSC